MRDSRVVRNDVEKSRTALECADDLRAMPFKHAQDRARVARLFTGARRAQLNVPTHEHAIFVHRRPGGAFGNGDLLQRRIVRCQESLALAVHADSSGNQIRHAREQVAITLDAGQLASLLQLTDGALQFLLALGRQPKQPEQFRHVRWNVRFLPQQSQKWFFHGSNHGLPAGGTAILESHAALANSAVDTASTFVSLPTRFAVSLTQLNRNHLPLLMYGQDQEIRLPVWKQES